MKNSTDDYTFDNYIFNNYNVDDYFFTSRGERFLLTQIDYNDSFEYYSVPLQNSLDVQSIPGSTIYHT